MIMPKYYFLICLMIAEIFHWSAIFDFVRDHDNISYWHFESLEQNFVVQLTDEQMLFFSLD